MGIFGGSSSSSKNVNNGALNSAFGGSTGFTGQAGNQLSALLGLGGNSQAAAGAMGNYANSAGMQFLQNTGDQAINENKAAGGLLNSGSTLKANDQYNTGLASTYENQYMQNLMNLGNLGLGAGGILAGSGATSQSQSKPGLSGSIGYGASSIGLSERHLKTEIIHLYTLPDDLPVYEFSYKNDPETRHVGVMVDEVEVLRPDALGPKVGIFQNQTVDYDKIGEL